MAEYIEREAALNKLCQDNCGHDYNGKCYNCYTAAFIEQYPAADVAPVVHGRWIGRYDHAVKVGWKCSICGCLIFHERDKSNYCPNCGARMDGDDNVS